MKKLIGLGISLLFLGVGSLLTTQFAAEEPPYTNQQLAAYMRHLATPLIGRSLKSNEAFFIETQGFKQARFILENWMKSPEFETSFKVMIDDLIRTGGNSSNGIDFDLPGRIAKYIVRNKLPFEQIITSEFCVDQDFTRVNCDTNAPVGAGVLSTRAFMTSHTGRFNLTRASALLNKFACMDYPVPFSLEPPAAKEDLLPEFRAESLGDLSGLNAPSFDDRGNTNCYSCHSQFAPHSQLFVKYDNTGLWDANANGVQDPERDFGLSQGNFFASHYANPERSASETGVFFGKEVKNLNEAAKALAESKFFYQCGIRNTLAYVFKLDERQAGDINTRLLDQIIDSFGDEKPSVQELFTRTLLHPLVIESAMKSLGIKP